MELSEYTETLRREVATVTRFAGEDVARAGQLITDSLDSAIRLTLLDVLSGAAEEITMRLEDTVIELRLSSGDPTFAVIRAPRELTVPPPPPPPAPPAAPFAEGEEETGSSRVTLRLPDSLKTRAEAAAARDGLSLNAWLVRAASRALEGNQTGSGHPPASSPFMGRGPGRRITGYAKS
jgi:HicB family